VIIPALNEERAIGRVLAAIPSWVDDVVVADNGSADRTADIARAHGARVVSEPRRGYGSACLAAMAVLDTPDVVAFLDGDYSDHPEEMDSLVDPILADQVDMVIGSRVLGRCERGALTPQARFGNWLSCLLLRLIWRVKYTDLGPFRAIRYSSLLGLGMRDPDYGWTVEMQVKAATHGLRAREVPVSYRPRIGESKVSGTVRGVFGAGTKILYTIIASALSGSGLRERVGPRRRLVVFTRYPEPGKVKTRLVPVLGADEAAGVHREMTVHTLSWADRLRRRRGVSVEVRYDGGSEECMRRDFGERNCYVAQGMGDLGVRLARAVTEAFSATAEHVVIVGTDCPELTADMTWRAYELLRSRDVVVGPAKDGGYYLIGLRRPLTGLFTHIPWGTAGVLDATLNRASELGVPYGLLPELRDVDRPEDLQVWEQVRAGA
jgi:rSAM/selenodomain-associated transferase 1